MNRIFCLFLLMLAITGCHTTDESPYADILSQPPYRVFTDSIKNEPDRSELYFRRAALLSKNNLPEPAVADLQKAWSLGKKEQYALALSNLLLEKQPVEAIDFLQKAVKELPGSTVLQFALARAYADQNKPAEALAVSKTILEKQPQQLQTLLLQAGLLEQKGDSTGAMIALEKAHQLEPRDRDISHRLMYRYAENRNPNAISLADSLIAADPERLYAHPLYAKGVYYTNTGDEAAALRFFNQTVQWDYNYMNAYIEKGKILLKQKKVVEALQTFTLANRIDPAFPDAWFWMGQCQEQMGQQEEAKLSYEKAYGLDKTFTEAKEAADKIR